MPMWKYKLLATPSALLKDWKQSGAAIWGIHGLKGGRMIEKDTREKSKVKTKQQNSVTT